MKRRRRKGKKEKKKKKKVDEEVKMEDETKDKEELMEPDIDALIAEGLDMEEIEILMEEYEKEKKRRKKEKKKKMKIEEENQQEALESERETLDHPVSKDIQLHPPTSIEIQEESKQPILLTKAQMMLKELDLKMIYIDTSIAENAIKIDRHRKEKNRLEKQKQNKETERTALEKLTMKLEEQSQEEPEMSDHGEMEVGEYQCPTCFKRNFATEEEWEMHNNIGSDCPIYKTIKPEKVFRSTPYDTTIALLEKKLERKISHTLEKKLQKEMEDYQMEKQLRKERCSGIDEDISTVESNITAATIDVPEVVEEDDGDILLAC